MSQRINIIKYILLIILFVAPLFANIDINNASQNELLKLNGIGKSKANKIIEYRKNNKCFKTPNDLTSIDGISKKLVEKNVHLIIIGDCSQIQKLTKEENQFYKVMFDPINLTFCIVIFILAFIDLWYKKDLKSQIVSVGVLGTFVGIFIGLQGFDPSDIVNSVNQILVGLKTAFFTSIVGMSVATILSIIEKLKANPANK